MQEFQPQTYNSIGVESIVKNTWKTREASQMKI